MRSFALAALFALTSATCEESVKAYCKKMGDDNDYFDCEEAKIKDRCDEF